MEDNCDLPPEPEDYDDSEQLEDYYNRLTKYFHLEDCPRPPENLSDPEVFRDYQECLNKYYKEKYNVLPKGKV